MSIASSGGPVGVCKAARMESSRESSRSKANASTSRLQFLDAVRGIAALSVAAQHIGERLIPAFAHFTSNSFQLGQFGVTLFFLSSGFIIPRSLEGASGLANFWKRRIFRLYPLYTFSVFCAIALYAAGHYHSMPRNFSTSSVVIVLAQFSMLQQWFGIPNIMPLFWTLNFEMVFYIMISIALVLGALRMSLLIAVAWLFLTGMAAVVVPQVLHAHVGNGLFFYFSTMFIGSVYYRVHHGQVAPKHLVTVLALSTVVMFLVNWSYFHGSLRGHGTHSFVPMLTAWLIAYTVFTAAYLLRYAKVPGFLCYLGAISYSVYLMQTFVLEAGPRIGAWWLTSLFWLGLTIALSSVTYRLIELPFIGAGRRRFSTWRGPRLRGERLPEFLQP